MFVHLNDVSEPYKVIIIKLNTRYIIKVLVFLTYIVHILILVS